MIFQNAFGSQVRLLLRVMLLRQRKIQAKQKCQSQHKDHNNKYFSLQRSKMIVGRFSNKLLVIHLKLFCLQICPCTEKIKTQLHQSN